MPAIALSVHLSRPEASLRGWAWLLALPVVVLALGISGEMMMPDRLPMMTRLIGHNAILCLSVIPVLSLPILAGGGCWRCATARRHAPHWPGALAGLLSAGLAATLYAAHCIDDSPLFVATWYTLATALVTAIGALAGAKWLKY